MGKNEYYAYETEAIDLWMSRYEIGDVPFNHPFSDDAQREQLRGDAQNRQDVGVG